jgi:uncharacterized protein YraI
MDYNCRVLHRTILVLLAAALPWLSGCELSVEAATTPTLHIITATLPPSATPRPSDTPAPPTSVPTRAPMEGTTTTQVNVRGEPSTSSPPLATLGPAARVQIVGKDPGGNWYQILFEGGPDGKGWVTATYVQSQAADSVPVIGGGPGAGGASGIALQQVNVRSGPGTEFNSLGTVNPQDVLTLTGKNSAGTWLQVEFGSGPQGKGWVNAGFVQVTGVENLPIVAESGEVLGTGTPTGIPATITPTVVAAPADGDSAAAPAASVAFSPSGARSLSFTGDVSAPDGDTEDWVQFTPYGSSVAVQVSCEGSGALRVEILQGGEPLEGRPELNCSSGLQVLHVKPGQPYLVHLHAAPAGQLELLRYTLTISSV